MLAEAAGCLLHKRTAAEALWPHAFPVANRASGVPCGILPSCCLNEFWRLNALSFFVAHYRSSALAGPAGVIAPPGQKAIGPLRREELLPGICLYLLLPLQRSAVTGVMVPHPAEMPSHGLQHKSDLQAGLPVQAEPG